MQFYKYTFKKALVSTSTYITIIVAGLIPWIMAFTKSANTYLPIILYFTFPLFIIFITYRAGQVFRDEIENQTMLTIQSKPITRGKMIIQGYLSVVTWIAIGVFAIASIPMTISFFKNTGGDYHKSIFVSLTQLLLGVIFGAIALSLSLTMKGKAFIGIMLGAFGAGFYILFGGSMFLQAKYTYNNKITESNLRELSYSNDYSGIVVDFKEINGHSIGTYKIDNKSNNITNAERDGLKKLQTLIKSYSENNKYSLIKWFDPSLHWTNMFGSSAKLNSVAENKDNELLQMAFRSEDLYTDKITEISNDEFSFELGNKRMLPKWYPFVVWSVIGSALIGLSLRKINRINIT